MTLKGQIYSVELTNDEIELIVNVLHATYKEIKEAPQRDQEESRKAYMRMQPLRELRNAFATIINRSFMGEDA